MTIHARSAAPRTIPWPKEPKGFTLIELIVSIAIILVLGGISIPALSAVNKRGKQIREINGAKAAVTAWLGYARDNDMSVLPGFLSTSSNANYGAALPGIKSPDTVTDAKGTPLYGPLRARYPFRLGPYLDYQFRGSILVNEQSSLTTDYDISFEPSLGLNVTFVGGDFSTTSEFAPTAARLATYGKWAVSKIQEIHSPTRMIVFASAHYNDTMKGYHMVKSPYFWGRTWATQYTPGGNAYNTLYVDFRHSDRAVAAMADGHVELLDFQQLEDMRRWSNQAAEADNPEWVMTPQ